MVGKPGRSGGARVGAGAPPGSGGAREGAGRPPGVGDTTLSAARILTPGQKWAFAEKALQHAERMLEILADIAEHSDSDSARVSAADKILDRALGKAPQHVDITALRHTEIVYHSVAEIRKVLAARGLPPVLLEHLPSDEEPDAVDMLMSKDSND
jgi:hypothetical protein